LHDVVVQFEVEAYKEFKRLKDDVIKGKKTRKKPTYEQLLNSIEKAIVNIKDNPHFGDLIPRRSVSKATARRYGTDKILRVELIGYWRMLYTLIGDD